MIHILKKSKLFSNIKEKDILNMLQCLNAKKRELKKGDILIHQGGEINHVGIVLEGMIQINKEDADGEKSLLAKLLPVDHFGEALCSAGIKESPVTVLAEKDGSVLLLDFQRILRVCTNSCVFHSKLIENMLQIVAEKNISLQERIEYLSKKTIRKRLLKYLMHISGGKKCSFHIPFNREELADFLCVDRSALSRELARLKKDKVLDYWKNQFKIL